MLKKALAGCAVTCVFVLWQSMTPHAAVTDDIVLYASDATLSGHWTRAAETSTAGGQILTTPDAGWANTTGPLTAPSNAADFTFSATANTNYRVWIRVRAGANSKYNDSLFVQFSDAVDASGAPLYRTGTTNGLVVNLQSCNGCALSGWGWFNSAYWLQQPSTVRFTTDGTRTLRLQTREDGFQIDQVVLSPLTFLSEAPGSSMNDQTIVAKPRTPFRGVRAALPGLVQAEDFDNGNQGVAYQDLTASNSGTAYRQTGVDIETATDGAYDIGWIEPGEWLTYSVNVASAGTYLFEARVASNGQGGGFHVELGGTNVSGALTIPNTGGWQNWTTVSTLVTLAAGPQDLKLVFDSSSAGIVGNVTWLRVSPTTGTPYTGTAAAIPGTVRAVDFDNGGEGLTFHDSTAGNSGGAYRASAVDIEGCSLGGYNVGWIESGEWLAYRVNVATAGTYILRLRVASTSAAGRMHVRFGETDMGTVAIPSTGGWQQWTSVELSVNLAAGPQTMRLVFDVGGFNVADVTTTFVPARVLPNYTRDILTKPILPTLGSAGYQFVDPTFGSRLVRVTDGNTTASIEPGYLNGSYRTPSATHQRMWNSASTKFFAERTDGAKFLYSWNSTTMTATLVERLRFNGACSFSRTNPNYIYGRSSTHGNHQTITRADLSTQPATYTVVVDAEVLIPALVGADTYLADIFTADDNSLTFTTGGEVGDFSHYVVRHPLDNPGAAQILNTNTRASMFKTYGVGPDIHSASPDLSGRFIQITVSGYQARSDYQWVWDTLLDTTKEITVTRWGHGGLGYGWAVNQDTNSGTWDGLQWTLRDLLAPNGPTPAPRNLIGTVLLPVQTYVAEHGNLNNNHATSGFLPYTAATYRYFDGPYNMNNPPTSYLNMSAWRAWDDEIIQVPTDGLGGPVARFAHHRSWVWPEPVAERQRPFEFWALPKANVSPDGRWAAFTSNWEHTLGMDAYDVDGTGTPGNKHRQDLFIVELIGDVTP